MTAPPVVTLRPAIAEDRLALWKWRNDPETRRASFNQAEISLEEHSRWLEESLARSDRRIYIVQADGVDAGAMRLDLAAGEATVNINLAPEWRGRGIGSRALRALCREAFGPLGLRRLTARVKVDNAASRAAFARAGFTLESAGDPLVFVRRAALRVMAAIQARMGSTRLPGKVLLSIAGQPVIQRIAERLARCQEVDGVVVSTSTAPQNDRIATLAERLGLPCVRSSEGDLVERLGRTAAGVGADALVRITADCPLVDPELVDRIVTVWRRSGGTLEYVSNVFPSTYPDGLDVEVLSREVLERLDREVSDPFFRESLTAYIREHPDSFGIANVEYETNLSHLRWTVDYPEDLAFAEAVYRALGPEGEPFGLCEVLALLERRPELGELNRHLEDTTVIRGIKGATYHAALRQLPGRDGR